ncbi:MAG: VOC family protein [Deltaproteobacteria bacterium]|nr:VOC family protein [Deltaproteobacteria bacterium]
MSLKPAKDSVDVGIFVSDIKKSLDFYHGTLGLEKIEELQTGFGTLHRLRYGTSDVKLMDPKNVPPAGAIGLEKQLGIRYLTFVIRDLSGLCAVLKQKGVEFTIPETQIRPGTRIAMVKDPDGNILEFVERG